jgi:hypothetical protein
MDPYTINRLGHIRQQEILQEVAEDQGKRSIRDVTWQLGVWLVTIGQKMMDVANPPNVEQPSAPNTKVENC